MTAGELIAELSKYPAETKVERYSDVYDTGTDIMAVEYEAAKPESVLGGIRFGSTEAVILLR